MEALKTIEKELKQNLTKKRYAHSIGVKYTSACLAMRYGYDVRQAMLAGVLHDCARFLSDGELLEECRNRNIAISEGEGKHPYLLHAKVGVRLAKESYAVGDEEVLGAIRYHATGKPGMSLLEEIVYVADYMEPNRNAFEGLDRIRREAFVDLKRTVALIAKDTVRYLAATKKVAMDEATLETERYYKQFL